MPAVQDLMNALHIDIPGMCRGQTAARHVAQTAQDAGDALGEVEPSSVGGRKTSFINFALFKQSSRLSTRDLTYGKRNIGWNFYTEYCI